MRYHKNEKVRMAAASVLSYRLPVDPLNTEIDLVVEYSSLFNEN
jgi:hypothetical protein